MRTISKTFIETKKLINESTNNNPDIIFKKQFFYNHEINIVFSESLTNRDTLNDFVLEFFYESNLLKSKNIKDILTFLEENIPTNKVNKLKTIDDMFYNLFSGFTLIFVEGEKEFISVETRATLNSSIEMAQIESSIKGPKDAFTENYQTNIGMIRKRIRDKDLWLKETIVGKYSKTKIGVLYINGIGSKELADILYEKIKEIDVESITDTNNVMELISSNNSKNVFPNFLSTEKPDFVAMHLLKGKIAVIIENLQLAIIIPINFFELFHSPEDYYQKPFNASYTRVVRFLSFLITIFVPAIYIAITTYNHETIPAKLLINFATQRDGVPFPTTVEAVLMLLTFEILKETDTRMPLVIGSSLSIVGALVLGEAAVTAGIVSPIMVIIIAITAISGFILSYLDVINGIRWWRLLFILFASFAGLIGVFVASLILLINLSSMYSLGLPYLTPIAPLLTKDLGESIIITKKKKYFTRKTYLTNNLIKGKEPNKSENN